MCTTNNCNANGVNSIGGQGGHGGNRRSGMNDGNDQNGSPKSPTQPSSPLPQYFLTLYYKRYPEPLIINEEMTRTVHPSLQHNLHLPYLNTF